MLRLLLLYHCPTLCRQLDTYELRPDLYATRSMVVSMYLRRGAGACGHGSEIGERLDATRSLFCRRYGALCRGSCHCVCVEAAAMACVAAAAVVCVAAAAMACVAAAAMVCVAADAMVCVVVYVLGADVRRSTTLARGSVGREYASSTQSFSD